MHQLIHATAFVYCPPKSHLLKDAVDLDSISAGMLLSGTTCYNVIAKMPRTPQA